MTKPASHYHVPDSNTRETLGPGVSAIVLSRDTETGGFTRLLTMDAGATTEHAGIQRHDGPEHALLVQGDLHDLTLDQTFRGLSYACRPTGMEHGPWRSEAGCTILEVHERGIDFDRPAREYFSPMQLDESAWEPLGELTSQFVLSADASNGAYTRLLRLDPGYDGSHEPSQSHTFTEEIYLISGTVDDVARNVTVQAGSYACRPPGMEHGPWRSTTGCLVYELRGPTS